MVSKLPIIWKQTVSAAAGGISSNSSIKARDCAEGEGELHDNDCLHLLPGLYILRLERYRSTASSSSTPSTTAPNSVGGAAPSDAAAAAREHRGSSKRPSEAMLKPMTDFLVGTRDNATEESSAKRRRCGAERRLAREADERSTVIDLVQSDSDDEKDLAKERIRQQISMPPMASRSVESSSELCREVGGRGKSGAQFN